MPDKLSEDKSSRESQQQQLRILTVVVLCGVECWFEALWCLFAASSAVRPINQSFIVYCL